MSTPPLESISEGVLLRVRVQPKASRNSVMVDETGRVRVALTAPPVDGAANTALLRFMARHLGLKRRQIQLHSGARSRDKSLLLTDCSLTKVASFLGVGSVQK